jgi:taurine dioxygenase
VDISRAPALLEARVRARAKLEILPTSGPLGAEVRADLRADPPGEVVYALHEALRRYHVILLREQELSEQRLVEIGSWFGPIYAPPSQLPVLGGEAQPPVVRVSNVGEDGVAGSGPLPMHSDLHNMPIPADLSVLYALEVPRAGGETAWSNLHQAHDELPEALRARLVGVKGVSPNPYAGTRSARTRQAAGEHQLYVDEELPVFPHPVVRTHPWTGRRSLYVGHYVERLVGIDDPSEAAQLLERLKAHVDQDHLYWAHTWRAGDLVISDNRCTNHRRAAFAADARRCLLRMMLGGSRPF